jgi:hypothetical protein
MPELTQDPMEFVRNMWRGIGFPIPGMVTPTFDTQDLGKRITDLKAVESWLRMNLSMLQMTIQNLEMQNATLNAVQTIGNLTSSALQPAQEAAQQNDAAQTLGETLQQTALWPWNLIQQVQAQLQKNAEEEHKDVADKPGMTDKANPKGVARAAPRKNTKKTDG